MATLIGFLGKKRTGKDTAADYLVREYGFKKMSLAGPLKEAVRVLFGLSDAQVNGDQKEKTDPTWGVTPRQILQFLGTDIFRSKIQELLPEIGGDFWVEAFDRRYHQILKSNPKVKICLADVRFQNEVDLIHRLGGKVIKIVRPSVIKDSHPSEKIDQVKGHDDLILNQGTLEQLFQKIDYSLSKKLYP